MIKGVNKSIIEIHDTNSEYFDRVLLFMNPKYSQGDRRVIKSEAARLIKYYDKQSGRVSRRLPRAVLYTAAGLAFMLIGAGLCAVFMTLAR